ncbi:MAG: hypothetical protein GY749_18290 [Desulfobacteraceae bacterium]|nr:hypothetical protein [Desulfobacteraceae bacterium]
MRKITSLKELGNVSTRGLLKAKGYETEREQSGVTDGREIKRTERILIVKSLSHEQQQKKGLERRLKKDSCPDSSQGTRQETDYR